MTPTDGGEDENRPLSSHRRRESVRDKWRLVYFIFFFCGIATLLPWNFFITAVDFFKFKLRNESLPAENYTDPKTQTTLQLMYENYLVIISSATNLVFMLINVIVTTKWSRNVRFSMGSVLLIIAFISVSVFAKIDTSSFQVLFFALAILFASMANAGSAFTQGSVIGTAGIFPSNYTKSVMEGQALGGIIAALANILTLYLASDPVLSGLCYFLIALAFIIGSIALFFSLTKIRYARYYLDQSDDFDDQAAHSGVRSGRESITSELQVPLLNETIVGLDPEPSVLNVLWSLKLDAFGIFFTFFITLSIFPAVLARIVPVHMDPEDPWKTKYFTPVICFLLFNVGDYTGRFLIGLLGVFGRRFYLLHNILVFLRIGFIPLILLCNVQPRKVNFIPVLLTSDAWPAVLTILLGISNGYLITSCIIIAVSSVRPNSMELAGNVMSLFIVTGIFVGGIVSLGMVTIV